MRITHTLCVDPGLEGTGWSLWRDEDNVRKSPTPTPWALLASGSFTPKGDSLQERIAAVHGGVRKVLLNGIAGQHIVPNVTLAVEHPQYFQGAAATNASGALVSLSMAAGAALSVANVGDNILPLLVPLSWKGNLPKEICCARIVERLRRDQRYKYWKPATNATHEIDAIGIGLHLQGRF